MGDKRALLQIILYRTAALLKGLLVARFDHYSFVSGSVASKHAAPQERDECQLVKLACLEVLVGRAVMRRHTTALNQTLLTRTSLESLDLPYWHRIGAEDSFMHFLCSNNYLNPTLSLRTEGIFWMFFQFESFRTQLQKRMNNEEPGWELCGFLILRLGFGHGFGTKWCGFWFGSWRGFDATFSALFSSSQNSTPNPRHPKSHNGYVPFCRRSCVFNKPA